MNPLKSLMACALWALCLLAVPARAEFQALEANGTKYWAESSQFKGLKVGMAEKGAVLFSGPDQSKVTSAVLKQKEAGKYVVVAGGQEFEAKVVKSVASVPTMGPTTKPAPAPMPNPTAAKPKDAAPKGVDADVWEIVNRNPEFKNLSHTARTAAAHRMQGFKKQSPDAYAKIKSAPAETGDQAVSTVVQAPADADPKSVLGKVAVVLDGKPSGQPNAVTATPIKMGGGGGSEDELKAAKEDPIRELSRMLKEEPPARADIEARFGRYATRSGANAFVDPAYMSSAAGKEAKVEERLKATVKSWIDEKIKAGTPDLVSELQYVMGFDQGVPGWAKPHPTLLILADPQHGYPKELEEGMKGWTAAVKKTSVDAAGRVAPGAYAGAPVKLEDWVFAFFEAASGSAHTAYSRPHYDPKDSILNNAKGDGGTPGGSSGKKPAGPSTGFGTKDMFEDGAVVGNVVIKTDGGYRRISLKVMTRRDPASGKMIDELGIFDISEPGGPRQTSNIFGQRFPMSQQGESVFRLDDTSKETNKYKLTMKNGKISFGTPDGHSVIETSQQELFERREQQARSSKVIRNIGGQDFKIVPQGGKFGALLYYPVDSKGKITGDGRTPSNFAYVNTIGSDGFPDNLAPPQTAIGFIGKPKADKSNFYYLVWNDDLKYFEPKPCVKDSKEGMACEFPKVAPPATTPATPTPSVAGPKGDETPTTPPQTGETKPESKVEQGNTVNGEGTASDEALKNCTIQEEAFSYNLKRQVDGGSGYTFFLTKKDGNAFQLCINANQSIFFQGIPIWRSAKVAGSNFIVEAVSPKGAMIPAEEIVTGNVAGTEYKVPGRPAYDLSTRLMYFLEVDQLKPEIISGGSGNGTVNADETAWVSYVVDLRTKEARTMQIRIKDEDPEKAAALIRKGFQLGNASKSAFADKDSVDAIIAHVKKTLPAYKGQGKPMVRKPMISIELWVKKDSQTLDPVTVLAITAAGRKTGVDKKGLDIIDTEPYDELLYCYQNHKLEGRAAHNAHLPKTP